jgi:phage baseplate assembly protein W
MANDEIAIGITLPLHRGKTGYFEQSFSILEQVKANLVNLLLTTKGERVFQPNFGSGLHELIFEQMDEEYDSRVRSIIQDAITTWMPFLIIVSLKVVRDTDRNRTLVEIVFSLSTAEEVTESVVIEF